MAIRPRGEGYQVDVKVKGKRIRESAKTMDEARRLEAEIRATLRKGDGWQIANARRKEQRTLEELLEHTEKNRWRHKPAGRTLFRAGSAVVEVLGADMPVSKVDTLALDRARQVFEAQGNSNGTINRKMAAISAMLTEAKQRGWVIEKPHIPKTKEGRGRIRYLSDQEEQMLIHLTRKLSFDSYADLWIVALYTGGRMGEVQGLEYRDVDFERNTVSFWETKNGEARTIPLTTAAKAALLRRKEERGFVRASDKVFYDIKTRRVNVVWDRVKSLMGLENDTQFVPHALRHTCASRLVQRGVDLRRVQQYMGHKAIQTTLRYAHLAPADLQTAANALDD